MKKEKVELLLKSARDSFLERDTDLLMMNANERSLTHKFAEYMQNILKKDSNWNVDCEYNRDGSNPKIISNIKYIIGQTIATDDITAVTVYPDIIVHKRGPKGPNVIIIEAKKDNNQGNDIEKIKAIKNEYGYKYGIFLKFDTNKKDISWIFVD